MSGMRSDGKANKARAQSVGKPEMFKQGVREEIHAGAEETSICGGGATASVKDVSIGYERQSDRLTNGDEPC